jgi:two-component system response regulator AtoC
MPESSTARFGITNLIGDSPPMRAIKTLVLQVAAGNSTVLLLGESGTGKDMIARAIHYESQRVEKPFMNITCTALPESLMESELFGYEKGAFTNALALKKGLFELASGGTVFMDEVGDMAPVLQSKLLRVLEEKAFKRIGGTEDVRVDVRTIAATNRDLLKRIDQGKFREDVYYRISTIPIQVPALRERLEDLPALCAHFLNLYNREFHKKFAALSSDVLEKLYSYHWPGNVRELRNVLERAILLSPSPEITPDDIVLGRGIRPRAAEAVPAGIGLPEAGCRLEDVEKMLVEQALQRSRGNQKRAAELLGLTRDQIRYKMEKFNLKPEPKA